ncbi:hypothetical protein KSX_13130 [Ktedonospora formicarum]|uniref:Uncharacterized protein n=1 Tax=Ktedonospora formicarum TaxID=2778364 RepID=A0A8J3MPQ3_9CHLR|nr:hypothetical protein KSX_13130 [Ktedonospora formicarum]
MGHAQVVLLALSVSDSWPHILLTEPFVEYEIAHSECTAL